ncbi:MAG TPA: hypothetical protein VHT24_00280, partial [Pseudacidobacterium sp.]|nr:hypothetical protein [Pseudacidobacterium sp.]
MEIRVIMYINLFLLTGYAIGLSIIGFHNRRFRQFFWFTAAYFGAGVGTVLRMRPRNLPDFFSLVLSNLLVIAALLLIHRCFAAFVKAKANIHWIEACILAGTAAGMIYYAEIRPSFNAR